MKLHGVIDVAIVATALLFGSFASDGWGRTVTNHPPVISGTPATTVQAGQSYDFRPLASDQDGDRLTFTIYNKPAWATFNRKTGELKGTPTSANVGTTAAITIRVADRLTSASLAPFDLTVTATTTVNHPPVISGSPITSVRSGSAYSFLPTTSDPDGDPLTFSIANKPLWAQFNATNGALTGTPSVSNVGTTSAVTISVSDGAARTSLAPFDLTVLPLNQATLHWVAPTMREDGSPLGLSEIAGFRVYHTPDLNSWNLVTEIQDSTVTSYAITGLGSGIHYFAVSVYDTGGLESLRSNVLSTTLQ